MAHHKALPLTSPRTLMLAASILALTAAAAVADTAPAAPLAIPLRAQASASALPADTILMHLPAGRDELTFRGEMASRRFSVVLGRTEAARISSFQVALRNTVSVLSEHSAVTISVNGRALAAIPANAADRLAVLPVAIPAGLLVPGVNTVQVTSALTHRVDCSVPATYELWATLDPAQTGFLVPRGAADAIGTVAQLAAVPLAEDGTTRIRVRMTDGPEEAEVEQAARAVQMLVRRARLVRPVVEIGAEPGSGPGIDLVVSGHEPADFASLPTSGGIGIRQEMAGGRVTVAVDPEAEDNQRAASPQHAVADAAEPPRDGFRKSFAQLGKATEVFTGRHYEANLPVVLPPDFMSTNDRARLSLDGSHAATLVDGDGLSLRVNGTLVSYLPLAAGKAERFDHREVELPLRFFHPGHNDVTIEGILSAEADAQCKTATMPREARLTIADTSELEFPSFAHLTTLPQIPAAMVVRTDLPVYLPGANRAGLEAGLTVLANMAAEGGPTFAPHVRLGSADADAPGLIVGSADQLPATISGALHSITRPVATLADSAAPAGDNHQVQADNPVPKVPEDVTSRLAAFVEGAESVLRNRGFFFDADKADGLALKEADVLVAAVAPGGKSPRTLFDVMPRFTEDATHWLVVTAADPNHLDAGLRQLTASGRWDQLRGEATRFDPANGSIEVRQPRKVTYVLSSRVAVTDIRPILGGLMSDNILTSLVVLFVVMGALGVSTHALVRRMGVR